MNNQWIERNAKKPTKNTTPYKFKDLDMDLLLNTFKLCDEIRVIRYNMDQSAAIASRLIARRTHSFRAQPSFVYFRKMNIALCRLKELNICDEIEQMKKSIITRQINGNFYLPTVKNFQYFLIRFQSFTKILVRIVMCARESHRLFLELVHRSAFVDTISMFIATLAKIWADCIAMCKASVIFYDHFFPFFKNFFDKNNTAELPESLGEWLGSDYHDYICVSTEPQSVERHRNDGVVFFDANDTILESTQEPFENCTNSLQSQFQPKLIVHQQPKLINLNDPSKLTTKQNAKVIMYRREEMKIKRQLHGELKHQQNYEEKQTKILLQKKHSSSTPQASSSQMEVDVGVKIDRDAYNKQNKLGKPKKELKLENLKTNKQIRKFLINEDFLRSKKNQQYTHGISDGYWKKIKNSVEQLLILGQSGLCLKKFKVLWTKMVDNQS